MITVDFILENKDKWEEYKKEINERNKDILKELIIEEPDIINIINLDKLGGWDISWILRRHPGLIKNLKPYLHKLDGEDISYVLINQPGLIKDLKPYLDKIDRWQLSYVLVYQPGLIKDLKPYLDKLDGDDMSYVLINQPKLLPYFKPYLYKLDETYISYISGERPEFSLLFKYVGTEYENTAYYYTYPSEISKLDEEEKYELSKKMVELIKEEKR